MNRGPNILVSNSNSKRNYTGEKQSPQKNSYVTGEPVKGNLEPYIAHLNRNPSDYDSLPEKKYFNKQRRLKSAKGKRNLGSQVSDAQIRTGANYQKVRKDLLAKHSVDTNTDLNGVIRMPSPEKTLLKGTKSQPSIKHKSLHQKSQNIIGKQFSNN